MHILYKLILTIAMLPIVAGMAAASDPAHPISYDQTASISPRELHQYLAENKARAYERTQRLGALYRQAPAQQADMDALYYKIELRIDEVAEIIYGRVTMRARSLAAGFSQPVLDFQDGMTVDSVFDNGTHTTAWAHADNFLTINLAVGYDLGEEFEVTVVYHGQPAEGGLQGFSFGSHGGVPLISSLSCPYQARTWWPCKDRQDDKPDSVDILVEVNSELFVTSNGTLRDSVDHGATTTYWWHEQYPIATYLVCLTATNFSHWRAWYTYGPGDTDSMPVDYYPYPEEYENALTHWPETVEMIGFFAETFGEYPFVREKYGMTHFNWGGCMEHQTNSSMTPGAFGYNRYVIAHELSHMWWGDYITCATWHHCWLNEGFASYCEALYAEYLGGTESLHNYMRLMEYYDGGAVYIYDTTDAGNIFSTRAYDKGAWVLHMLRGISGDSLFFDGLVQYASAPEFTYGDVTTDEFRDFWEAVSGLELDYFFTQWIYDEYFPIYRYGCLQDPVTEEVRLYITQIQQENGYRPLFTMPVQLKFNFEAGGDTTVMVFNNQVDQGFVINLPEPVANMSLDPDNWILKRAAEEDGFRPARHEYVFDDHLGDGNGRPDPGESGIGLVITVQNPGADVRGLTMAISTPYPEITFANNISSFGDIMHGQQADNSAEPIIFSVADDFPPTIVDFSLTFSAYGGAYTRVETLAVNVGPPQVIIIDDDESHPSNYEHYFADALYALRTPYYVWDKDTLSSPPADTLADYPFVIWFTGDHRYEMLTVEDVANLRNFLDDGGRLFLTGQDIARDLSDDPDSTFLRDYLHVRYAPGTPVIMVDGVPGDPIGDGHLVALGGPGGAANQTSPDKLAPVDDLARPIYTYYYSSDIAGVHVADRDYRIVFFGFGFEGIAGDLGYTTREQILPRVLDWLGREGPDYFSGDFNWDWAVNPLDVVWMVDFVYLGNDPPPILNAADVNADCLINAVDVVILVNFVYKNQGALQPGCAE